ncbi:hypothetical protein Cob_v009185 [Colletotrichum orbiculare MAFF 240422]|uniref:Rhodopsin domain-containing protein n=1 Tax=Colletotrichum orbiculare (strain 104-T / ATCC 96160 / CBS 514.97 / LARS 414 / MAFF 240422) TaxID=1213857 RepID=A0A484FHL4_COLOR|nr:hypothetical protein Cob_v009185 [Colletotrichum orbiculare MAFF 240422]
MAARLFVRGKMLGKLQLDDYLIIGSVICSWVNVATAIVAVSYGMGLHFATLTTEQKSGAIFWTMVGFPAGVMSFGLPKVAVVVLLTRILNPGPRHKNILWGLSLFCLLSLTANMVLLFIRCRPTQSNWDFSLSPRCWDKWILVYFAVYTGSLAAFVDGYLAIYPAIVLARLQMTTGNPKLETLLTISSSSVVAAYKCTRLPSLASDDYTYDTADLAIWTIVEGGTMTIAACIPVLQPLDELLFGRRTSRPGVHKKYSSSTGQSEATGSESVELSRHYKSKKYAQRELSSNVGIRTVFEEVTTTTTATSRGNFESVDEQHKLEGKIIRTDAFSVKIEQKKA